ncbi:hypothetical protein NRB20_75390 [Nocardia sp. RB20]|uniref:Uncharacterized protein n=1 Tax=Nocardia macrotermitis TaxID=2585198 RepID=A0A7K0DHY3_9NOCA|nr:hypothetical protein [Nocardia macrotermitis]
MATTKHRQPHRNPRIVRQPGRPRIPTSELHRTRSRTTQTHRIPRTHHRGQPDQIPPASTGENRRHHPRRTVGIPRPAQICTEHPGRRTGGRLLPTRRTGGRLLPGPHRRPGHRNHSERRNTQAGSHPFHTYGYHPQSELRAHRPRLALTNEADQRRIPDRGSRPDQRSADAIHRALLENAPGHQQRNRPDEHSEQTRPSPRRTPHRHQRHLGPRSSLGQRADQRFLHCAKGLRPTRPVRRARTRTRGRDRGQRAHRHNRAARRPAPPDDAHARRRHQYSHDPHQPDTCPRLHQLSRPDTARHLADPARRTDPRTADARTHERPLTGRTPAGDGRRTHAVSHRRTDRRATGGRASRCGVTGPRRRGAPQPQRTRHRRTRLSHGQRERRYRRPRHCRPRAHPPRATFRHQLPRHLLRRHGPDQDSCASPRRENPRNPTRHPRRCPRNPDAIERNPCLTR